MLCNCHLTIQAHHCHQHSTSIFQSIMYILYSILSDNPILRSEWLILRILHYTDMVCVYMYILGIKLQNVQTVLRHFLCFHFLFHLSPSSGLPVVGHAQFPWNLASLQHSLQLLHLFQTLSTGNGLLQHTQDTLHLRISLQVDLSWCTKTHYLNFTMKHSVSIHSVCLTLILAISCADGPVGWGWGGRWERGAAPGTNVLGFLPSDFFPPNAFLACSLSWIKLKSFLLRHVHVEPN